MDGLADVQDYVPEGENEVVKVIDFNLEIDFPAALNSFLLSEGMSTSNAHAFCHTLTDYGVRTWEHFDALALEMEKWWDTIEGYICGTRIPRSDWAVFRKWLVARAG